MNTKRNEIVEQRLAVSATKRVSLLFLFPYRESRINEADNEARSDRYLAWRVGIGIYQSSIDEIRGKWVERNERKRGLGCPEGRPPSCLGLLRGGTLEILLFSPFAVALNLLSAVFESVRGVDGDFWVRSGH